jgi:MFS family permease
MLRYVLGLFLIRFGCGALFAGPFSETFGRNPVYIVTLGLFMIFVMASGLAPNISAQLSFRFLAGFFGSTPLVCAGGSISDLWSPMERVFAFPVFANAAFSVGATW